MRKTFIQCGILGWGMEILWTGLDSFRRRDYKLTGHSSLWMFPIYGCAAFIGPLSRLLQKKHPLFRGNLYMLGIFLVEFSTGLALKEERLVSLGLQRQPAEHPWCDPSGLRSALAPGRTLLSSIYKNIRCPAISDRSQRMFCL